MPERFVRAQFYRNRAEELRTIAQDWLNDEATRVLVGIALDYEDMAERLELSAKKEGVELT